MQHGCKYLINETQRVPQDRTEVPKQNLKQHGCKYLITETQIVPQDRPEVPKQTF